MPDDKRPDRRIVVASHNEGKVREIGELLGPLGYTPVSAATLKLAEPEESGATFVENALIKARAAAQASKMVSLADDSGLEVIALNGAPGVVSARWAGPAKDFNIAMARVNSELGDAMDRRARFVCVLALVRPDGGEIICEGEVKGEIVWPPRGHSGFGYDPIFVPDGRRKTFGEMAPAEKHAMSHRARAFAKLVEALK
jgi:XTP/dITP diphosphohydrolase